MTTPYRGDDGAYRPGIEPETITILDAAIPMERVHPTEWMEGTRRRFAYVFCAVMLKDTPDGEEAKRFPRECELCARVRPAQRPVKTVEIRGAMNVALYRNRGGETTLEPRWWALSPRGLERLAETLGDDPHQWAGVDITVCRESAEPTAGLIIVRAEGEPQWRAVLGDDATPSDLEQWGEHTADDLGEVLGRLPEVALPLGERSLGEWLDRQ